MRYILGWKTSLMETFLLFRYSSFCPLAGAPHSWQPRSANLVGAGAPCWHLESSLSRALQPRYRARRVEQGLDKDNLRLASELDVRVLVDAWPGSVGGTRENEHSGAA